jgi:predicted ferric reductase
LVINYRGEGVFIAGGAGVTPFISIFRYLQTNNEIGNNKPSLPINERRYNPQEFENLLDKNFINILSNEKVNGYAHGQPLRF